MATKPLGGADTRPLGGADTSNDSGPAIARAFVAARSEARALPDYPGDVPGGMDAAYAIQDEAIGLWDDQVVGWKIGRIPDAWLERLKAPRLAGPIFRRAVWTAVEGETMDFPVFEGGFAAVEAEFILKLAKDAPADRTDWTAEQAADMVETLIVGVEPAGSPLATINVLGPPVVASDFGNNAGLILGHEVPDWRERLMDLTCETFIDGQSVGKGGAATIPGGPLGALAFLLELNARRGRPLKAGDLISTGAATGIHDIVAGQSSRVVFNGVGEILCRAVPAQSRQA
ncbi:MULTISPECIES: 2-keto-4-pentenoate hydratase [Brevundimonas]|nr:MULTISPECIES: 2-keto-4-pentenoate hydratase [Brevundimonas]